MKMNKVSVAKKPLSSAKCYLCDKLFQIKRDNATGDYRRIYDMSYWTGKSTKDKICISCIYAWWPNTITAPKILLDS